MSNKKRDLRHAFKRLGGELPRPVGRMLRWLRHPASRPVRIPAGLLLIMGGFLWFLPLFGVWMLPVGLMLIAHDVPVLQGPMSRFAVWGSQILAGMRRWARRRLGGFA